MDQYSGLNCRAVKAPPWLPGHSAVRPVAVCRFGTARTHGVRYGRFGKAARRGRWTGELPSRVRPKEAVADKFCRCV